MSNQSQPVRSSMLQGLVILILLALLARIGHWLLPVLPGILWALLTGVIAGIGVDARKLPALPFQIPLTVGLILMGAQVQPSVLNAIGLQGFGLLIIVLIGTFLVYLMLSRLGLLPARLAGLLALGMCGCGISAITAAGQSDSKAGATQQSLASLAVLITGAASLVLLPLLAGWFEFDARTYGLVAGLTVANTAEAVAVAQIAGPEALGIAASVKLVVNALQGIPIMAYLWRFAPSNGGNLPARVFGRVPIFVWGFAAVAVLAWLGGFDVAERSSLGNLTSWAFFIALVGVGFQTRLQVLRRVGVRPLLLATLVWLGVTALIILALN